MYHEQLFLLFLAGDTLNNYRIFSTVIMENFSYNLHDIIYKAWCKIAKNYKTLNIQLSLVHAQ